MREYILQRILLMVPTLLGVSVVVFTVMHLVPGDVVLQMLGESARFNQQDVDRLRQQLGLDRPLHEQYLSWMSGVVRGDLGRSLWTGQTVVAEILRRLPITVELGLLSMAIGVTTGVLFGVIAAARQDSWVDHLVRLVSIAGLAVPNFLVGTLLVMLPAIYFGYFGSMRFVSLTEDPGQHFLQLLLPAIALSLRLSAGTMRMSRSALLEVLRQDYVRTAMAKGLTERMMLFRHALKNSMIPVITLIGDQASLIVGGTVILESIFGLPGVGRLVLESITQRDLTMVQGVVMFFAVVVVMLNLLVDLSYGWFDPRIRYGSK